MKALVTLQRLQALGFELDITDHPFPDSIRTSPGRPPHALELEIRRNRENLVALIQEGLPLQSRKRGQSRREGAA